MITTTCQRWRERRDSYRPAGEVIRTGDFEVAELPDDTTARTFVERHHYSGSYPAARWRFGLYERGALVGVAVFSHPSNDRALTRWFPGPATDSVELGRFVLLDGVAGNGETWFLGRAFDVLRREGLAGVLSFSDPEPRTEAYDAERPGPPRQVFGGHLGTIYQAHNALYRGRATPRTLHLLPNGTVFSDRAAQKIRAGERGWRYAVEQLVAAGATSPAANEDPRAWLRAQLPRVTRTQRHPGNHTYVWGMQRAVRRELEKASGLPYPKKLARAA